MSDVDMAKSDHKPGPAVTGDGDYMDYREAKRLAGDADTGVRVRLAQRDDVQPEVLYFLAEDDAPEVRRAIAANDTTPRQADQILVEDVDDEVRISLARKIARLAPDLTDFEQDMLQQATLEVLEKLAADQLPRVRQIIAEEVRHLDHLPRPLIRRLAEDVEVVVAAPVLEYSPLLSDVDLVEIIQSRPVQGALGAIARREGVSETVSDAIAEVDDEPALAQLLTNQSAQIREETLDQIVERAEPRESLHEPLVKRGDLSHRAVRRIAQFVTASLLTVLEKRYEVDPDTTLKVARAVDKRLSADGNNEDGLPEHRAEDLYKAGKLDDEAVSRAAKKGDREFLIEALSLKTGVSKEAVKSVLGSDSPKTITALCWKAGLGMRVAYDVQLRIARVPTADALRPRDGIDYPITGSEMRQVLRFFLD